MTNWREGHNRLWGWFSLSYASWLTLPRSMMHEMPDDWQKRMAELMEEWDDTWNTDDLPTPHVVGRDEHGRFQRWPSWVCRYRHPDQDALNQHKVCDAH